MLGRAFSSFAVLFTLSAASSQDQAVGDLFRPDPKLTFLETRGQLLPSEARHVALRVEAIDTFELRVRPVKPQDIHDDDDVSRSRHPQKLTWPLKMRLSRPRDSLTTWTSWLDLDHLARKFPGMFLEVKAIAGPRAYRPSIKEANCDSVWAMGRFLVSDLGVVATEIHSDSIQLQTFDLARSKPWPGIELLRVDGPGKRHRTDSAGKWTIRDPDFSERWLARTTGSPYRIALVRLHDASQDLFDAKPRLDLGNDQLPWTTFPGGIRLHPYVFRDLHLPGDTLVVGCLARMRPGTPGAKQKLSWRISSTSGRDLDSGSSLLDASGHAQWRWPIPEKSWEHEYRIETSLGDARKTIVVQVEERKLPRSSVDTRFDNSPSSTAPFGRLRIHAKWNTGRPLANGFLRVHHRYDANWYRYRTEWTPSWPWHAWQSWDTLQEATTDSNGVAEIPLPGPDARRVGQVATLFSDVTVFEEGGTAITTWTDRHARTWTPRPALVFHLEDDTLLQLKALWFSIQDSQIGGKALSASLRWESEILASRQLSSGQTWVLPVSVINGRMDDRTLTPRLSAVLCESGTTNCVGESVDIYRSDSNQARWSIPYPSRKSFREAVEPRRPDSIRSTVLPPRAVYEGDTAPFRWESRQAGFSWIRIFQGQRLVRSEFRPTRIGSNLWRIPTDSSWWPGVRIAVFELSGAPEADDWLRTEEFNLPIRRKPSALGISIQPDSVFHPNSIGHVRIRNPLGREGSVVVSATDQAILDLTGFRMVDPSGTFDAPEATFLEWWNGCGHRTRLYGSDESATCATEPRRPWEARPSRMAPPRPSDVELGGENGLHRNFIIPRFSTRPLAWVSPITRLSPVETVFDIPVPAFLGNARLRAVVSSGRDRVVLDTSVLVRSALEGTFTSPFFLEPGDTTHAAVRVFGKPSLPGTLRMATEGPLQLATSDSTTLLFDSTGTAFRRVAVVATSPKEARIAASIHQGSDSLDLANEMDVRGDRRQHTEVVHAAAVDGSIALSLPHVFSDSGLRCRMEVSTGPILGLDRRIVDLAEYKHACLEQVVSKALPELLSSQLTSEGSFARDQLSSSALRAAFRKLREFPQLHGLLGLWPHSIQPDTFASIWTAQFLAMAQERNGSDASLDLDGLSHAVASLRLPDPTEELWRLALLPRLGFRKSSHPEFFADSISLDSLSRLRLSREARWILAWAWHHRLHNAQATAEMERARSTPDSLSRKSRRGRASRLRDQAWALQATMSLSDSSERDRYLALVAQAIEGDVWLSTQESGALMIALAAVLPKLDPKGSSFVDFRTSHGAWKRLELSRGRTSVPIPRCSDSVFVRATEDQPFLRLQTIREGALKSAEILRDSGFSVAAALVPESPSATSPRLREGDVFRLEVRIRNTSGQDLTNVAATTWLPAGWILRNDPGERMDRPIRHVERRADRIAHHFDLSAGKETILRIPLRALQEGSYQGPEVVVEALYDNALRGHWNGPRAQVEHR